MKRLKLIGRVCLHLLVVAALFTAFGFIHVEKQKQQIQEVDLRVDHRNGSYFVDKEQLMAQLSRNGYGALLGSTRNTLRLRELEISLKRNPFVADAQAYIDIQGRLSIRVSQREPVLRVINRHNESFYIDHEGFTMPVSTQYSAGVMVANGHIDDRPAPGDSLRNDGLRELFMLNEFLRSNELYNALFVQIYVNARGEYELIPRLGNHTVLLGDLTDLTEKMEKLLALYRSALDQDGWQQYRQVNLKFKDQVICKR
ncbi:MAG: cell division protein FtsQ/DivIB [Bacteroidia bacterium]